MTRDAEGNSGRCWSWKPREETVSSLRGREWGQDLERGQAG